MPTARLWRGLGQLALAAALAVGFLSLLRAPAPAPGLGTPAQPAGTSVHGPGALSVPRGAFRRPRGRRGVLGCAAGRSGGLRPGRDQPAREYRQGCKGVAATYDQGALSVWYSHSGDALDQGFTITRRLPGAVNKLVIALNTSGALRPVLDSPTSLSFEGSKVPAITYSSLKVTDATGRVLPARLGVSGTSVRIMLQRPTRRVSRAGRSVDPAVAPHAADRLRKPLVRRSRHRRTERRSSLATPTPTGPPCTPPAADRGPRAWR